MSEKCPVIAVTGLQKYKDDIKEILFHFPYKGYTIYDPWIREDLQEEPFAWRMHEEPKAGVNPFDYYGKRAATRFIVGIVEKNQ